MNTEPSGGAGANSAAPSGNRSATELARMAAHEIGDSLARSKVKLSEFQGALTDKTRECVQQTDAYVRENPWKAIGWAAGIGFVIGLIVRRR